MIEVVVENEAVRVLNPVRNVVNYHLTGKSGLSKLLKALRPYADFPEVRDHIKRLEGYK